MNAMHASLRTWAWFGVSLVLVACGERDASFEEPRALMTPTALSEDVAYVDRARHEVLLLDVEKANPAPVWRAVSLPSQPLLSQRRMGTENEAAQLLVLCAGRAETRDVESARPSLEVIDARDDASVSYPLKNTFDTVRQSEDGRYAFLFLTDPANAPGLFANPNEAALVDLDASPGSNNPRFRSLISLGSAPSDVVFSPAPMVIGDSERRVAVLLAQGYVSIIDLAHPERPEKVAPLAIPEVGRSVTPVQVLFEETAGRIYVRTAEADAINVLDLTPSDAGEDAFVVSVTQVTAGRRPSDMLLYEKPDGTTRLLVVAQGSREIAVIEPRSGQVVHVLVDAAIERAIKFTSTTPGTTEEEERVLLFASGSAAQSVTFVDLVQLEQRKRLNLDTYLVPAPVQRTVFFEDRGIALLVHAGSGGDGRLPRFSILDLAQRTLSPILANVSLQNAVFDDEAERLWVARPGDMSLGFLDLDGFQPGEVLLDAPIAEFLPMTATTGRVVVTHPGAEGYVTLLDAMNPSRRSAKVLRGFAYAALLDRGAR